MSQKAPNTNFYKSIFSYFQENLKEMDFYAYFRRKLGEGAMNIL